MKIAIVGVGGLGGYIGGRLAHSGQDVTFIARGQRLAALRQQGLQVRSPDGEFTIQPVQVTDNPAAVGPVDVDLEQGRRLEIEAWNGAIVRYGRQVGVPTPVNDVIYACLKPYANGAS